MSVNQFTLNNLYNNGIIDYVPYDLCGGINVSALNGMQNPYLNNAMQGTLYQSYGNAYDTFTPSAGMNGFGNQNIGTYSQAGSNAFGFNGIGTESQAGVNAFGGVNGNIGFNNSNAGLNGFGVQGVGVNSNAGINAFGGGFGRLGQDAATVWGRIPSPVKGIAAAGIVLLTLISCFKGKKKVPVQKTGFWKNLNPVNWFRKNKK